MVLASICDLRPLCPISMYPSARKTFSLLSDNLSETKESDINYC